MKQFVSVLDTIIRISEIKKVTIIYNNGVNYANELVHSLFITYMNDKQEEFETTDFQKAQRNYEKLSQTLLNCDDNIGGD